MANEDYQRFAQDQIAKIIPVLKRVIDEKYAGALEVPELEGDFKEMGQLITAVVDRIEDKNAKILSLYERDYTHLKSWVESMTSGVLMFDSQKQVLLTNSRLKEITGLTDVQMNLDNLVTLLESGSEDKHGEFLYAQIREGIWNRIGFKAAIELVMNKGFTVKYMRIPLKDRYYEVHINPVKDEHDNVSGGAILMHDVTLMAEVDKMKTEFVSVASHQLRTPLTAMRLFAEMLLNEEVGKLNREQRDYVENLQDSTLRMIKLVNEFLNVSRLETGRLKIEPELTQLEDLIEKVIGDLALSVEKRGCKLKFEKPKKELLKVAVDPGLMYEMVNNLLTNAIAYSPEKKGIVKVKIERKAGDKSRERADKGDDKMKKKAFGSTDYVLISVKDNGIGIPKDAQGQIFKKFFRAENAMREKSDGSGLGLYLVNLIVESAGCKVWFESQVGKGTTFYLAIPIYGMLGKKGEKGLAGS